MDISLFSLRVFLKVAESKSFTKAAEALFLSQPAVSLQIQKIEQIFQTPLFIRNHSGYVRLTPAGETLRKHAEVLMQVQQEIAVDMAGHSPGLNQKIRIGTCCIAGEHLVSFGLSSFQELHPEISLALSITRCEKVFNGILEGTFDIGVTGLPPKNRYLAQKRLVRVPIIFFETPKGKKSVEHISIVQLLNRPLVLRDKGSGCRIELDNFITAHGINPKELNVVTESESNEALKKLVKDGYGISALPDFMVRQEINSGLFSEIVLLEGQPRQSFFMVYRKQENFSFLMQELLNSLLTNAKKLVL